MMLPSGKDHYRIISYYLIIIARLNTVSYELRSIGAMHAYLGERYGHPTFAARERELAKVSPHPFLHDAGKR